MKKQILNLGKALTKVEQKAIIGKGDFGQSNTPYIAQIGGNSNKNICACNDGSEFSVSTCGGTECDNACSTNGGKYECN